MSDGSSRGVELVRVFEEQVYTAGRGMTCRVESRRDQQHDVGDGEPADPVQSRDVSGVSSVPACHAHLSMGRTEKSVS